jgi:uncharacterized UBP type Zn finger protein
MATASVKIDEPCDHASAVKVHEVNRPAAGCEDCLKMGGRWVHLRACLTCGKIGCCDSSPNRHATRHFQATQHPIITSVEPNETWVWCYEDETAISS